MACGRPKLFPLRVPDARLLANEIGDKMHTIITAMISESGCYKCMLLAYNLEAMEPSTGFQFPCQRNWIQFSR